MSEGRGHGKVILLGEHAVVHGHPALAMAIDLGVRVTARPGHGTLTVPAWDLAVDLARDAGTAPARALLALADAIGVDARGVALVAEAPLPARAGLGSSAALSVAVVRALAAHAGHALDDDAVARAADAGERVFHGNPSGIDVALAARGGVGRFVRGVGLMPLVAPPLTLVVALSGEPRDTAARVAHVAAQLAAAPTETRAILDLLGQLADAGQAALLAGHPLGLGECMDTAHAELAGLGLSTPRLDALAAAARAVGALGAKLTGAGGGGAVIALAPGREAQVAKALEARGAATLIVHTQPASAAGDAA